MSKAATLLTQLDEFMGFMGKTPSDASVHRATHSLVHADSQRAADDHADKFRTVLQDKGLPKSQVNAIVSRARKDAYARHYKNSYSGTRREISKEMMASD